jgi:TonB family protein
MPAQSISKNAFGLLIVALILSLLAISCAQIGRITGSRTQSDKARLLNCMVPVNTRSSDTLESGTTAGEFLILLPNSKEILLYTADSDPIDLNRLGELVKPFAENDKLKDHTVYIAAAIDVEPHVLTNIFDLLRENGIEKVRLLTSGRERPENEDCTKGWRDIPPPDRFLEVKTRGGNYSIDGKPNPLTLLVRTNLGRPNLNNESYKDEDELVKKLIEIFEDREENGVYRESTNEIEKTVYVEVEDQEGAANKNQKYGDIVRLIDVLKSAGASPIVIGDLMSDLRPTKIDRSSDAVDLSEPTPPPPIKAVPKIISGGVLNGKATFLPKPPYPPAAKAVRASGSVSVQVTVDENGNVTQTEAVSGHPLLRAAAATAAKQARFAPTMLSGQRVKVSGVLTYNFVPDMQ